MRRRRAIGLIGAALAVPGTAWTEAAMQPAADFDWSFLADTVMGGVSRGQARLESAGGVSFVRLTGTVSTENRGGFIQVRAPLPDGIPADAAGLRLRVRGNGERYFVHLRAAGLRPWQFWQAGFDTGPDWRDVTLTWPAFAPQGGLPAGPPAAGAIRSLGLAAYGRDHAADVSLAALGWV
ncbi:MAG: CIA30 family protein [Rhodobacteraceae bacterium]|jgi:hypothetical protein|nr:CIA30 family protein [Paracoccaceae bacterium]MBL4557178.1 CIA30 family protein [Paracoccaceae bacterium]HBG97580.1 NADH ubiquinone oxidoreductase [Paracoccaceae bacterium]